MAEFNKAPSRQATDETAPSSNSEYSYSEQQEDLSLIEEAEEYASNERLLDASKLLKRVENESLLKEKHKKMIRWAEKNPSWNERSS